MRPWHRRKAQYARHARPHSNTAVIAWLPSYTSGQQLQMNVRMDYHSEELIAARELRAAAYHAESHRAIASLLAAPAMPWCGEIGGAHLTKQRGLDSSECAFELLNAQL